MFYLTRLDRFILAACSISAPRFRYRFSAIVAGSIREAFIQGSNA